MLHMSKVYMPTFVNNQNNSKTVPISLYFVQFSTLGKPTIVYMDAILNAVKNLHRTTQDSLFHILK